MVPVSQEFLDTNYLRLNTTTSQTILGNVGIGTTSVQKLQVNGRVRANDFISDQTATFAYNGNGTVNTITKGTRVLTFSYNGDGTINTVGDGALTSTFSYNGDGTIAAITKA
jgi:hypothetical protein